MYLIEKSAVKHLEGTRCLCVCMYVYLCIEVVCICRHLVAKKDCSHAESVSWSSLQRNWVVKKATNWLPF